MYFFKSVSFLAICATIFVGCGTGGSQLKASGAKVMNINEPLSLELKTLPGRTEKSKYYSHTIISNYEDGQIVRQKEETVDFQTKTEHPKRPVKPGLIPLIITTIKKDGLLSLHDLAFPEEGESLEVLLKKDADVVRAGDFPSNSVFYVPPIPLPKKPVKVGDTWGMKSSWVNYKSGIPLKIDLAAILKNIYSCGNEKCADIEVSGSVKVTGALAERVQFKSRIGGRLLFNIDNGVLVWSHVQSQEEMLTPNGQVKVNSCLLSKLLEPSRESLITGDPFKCEPSKLVLSTPMQP